MCATCEFPTRRLWTYQEHPQFLQVKREGWAAIDKCPECGQLWCRVAYEPHSAFSFWAAWPKGLDDWEQVLKKEEGLPYYEWHEAVLVEDHTKLPEDEKQAVEAWRQRAYYSTPIDHRNPRFCQNSADLDKVLGV